MICQICGGAPRVVWRKERNVSCGDYFVGRRLYRDDLGELDLLECMDCGFGYFPEMHAWPEEKYRNEIYNADYHLCDPPFRSARPSKLAAWLGDNLMPCDLIDFGGGEGKLAELLGARQFRACCYDPFYADTKLPSGTADVVTAFEVVEHVPDQHQLFRALTSLCRRDGLIILSTSLKPKVLIDDWWYTSARNGHVSFHTSESLKRTMAAFGLASLSLSHELHLAAPRASALHPITSWRAIAVCDRPGFVFLKGWSQMVGLSAAGP